jgi:hypothetical protein
VKLEVHNSACEAGAWSYGSDNIPASVEKLNSWLPFVSNRACKVPETQFFSENVLTSFTVPVCVGSLCCHCFSHCHIFGSVFFLGSVIETIREFFSKIGSYRFDYYDILSSIHGSVTCHILLINFNIRLGEWQLLMAQYWHEAASVHNLVCEFGLLETVVILIRVRYLCDFCFYHEQRLLLVDFRKFCDCRGLDEFAFVKSRAMRVQIPSFIDAFEQSCFTEYRALSFIGFDPSSCSWEMDKSIFAQSGLESFVIPPAILRVYGHCFSDHSRRISITLFEEKLAFILRRWDFLGSTSRAVHFFALVIHPLPGFSAFFSSLEFWKCIFSIFLCCFSFSLRSQRD